MIAIAPIVGIRSSLMENSSGVCGGVIGNTGSRCDEDAHGARGVVSFSQVREHDAAALLSCYIKKKRVFF